MCSEACGSASLNPIENRGLCCTGAADRQREVAEEPNEGSIPHPSSMWELMRWGWTSLLQHGALDEGRPRVGGLPTLASSLQYRGASGGRALGRLAGGRHGHRNS